MSYKYQHVKTARVIDGDTVVLDIDMGNRITWTAPFRLAGINAPERGHPAIPRISARPATAQRLMPHPRTVAGRWRL